MALIRPNTPFDPDQLPGQVIGIASELGVHDSGPHKHLRHQLLFAQKGCMSIELDSRLCLLPPTRAAWIPSGTLHRVMMRGVVAYRSLYFTPSRELPNQVQVVDVNPLLREIIERVAHWPWNKPEEEQRNIISVLFDEIISSPTEHWQLQIPKDKRLASWLLDVRRGVMLPERLNHLAKTIGASSKTISRIFISETNMSYQAWRQQWRLLHAIELLVEGLPLSEIAQKLDFSSDSAFIFFFKAHTGQTPMKYMKFR